MQRDKNITGYDDATPYFKSIICIFCKSKPKSIDQYENTFLMVTTEGQRFVLKSRLRVDAFVSTCIYVEWYWKRNEAKISHQKCLIIQVILVGIVTSAMVAVGGGQRGRSEGQRPVVGVIAAEGGVEGGAVSVRSAPCPALSDHDLLTRLYIMTDHRPLSTFVRAADRPTPADHP